MVRRTLLKLARGINELTGTALLDAAIEAEVQARYRKLANPFYKNGQLATLHGLHKYLTYKLIRIAKPHPMRCPRHGPRIAVWLHLLTRKSLGGLHTKLQGQALAVGDRPLPGLYAMGKTTGFGGDGVHGYRSLAGTFLGRCLFSGMVASKGAAVESWVFTVAVKLFLRPINWSAL